MKSGLRALHQDALTNFLNFSYNEATNYRNGPKATAGSDQAYLMSRNLGIPILGPILSVFGIGHLAVTNGNETKELLGQNIDTDRAQLRLYGKNDPGNANKRWSSSFGTSYQSLDSPFSTFQSPGRIVEYNFMLDNSNRAVYEMMRK